jgi:hypothetical protein
MKMTPISQQLAERARSELGLRIDTHLAQLYEHGAFGSTAAGATPLALPSQTQCGPGPLAVLRSELQRDIDAIFGLLIRDLAQLDAATARDLYHKKRN